MKAMRDTIKMFGAGFLKDVQQAPKLYFLPVLAIWKCCHHHQLSQDEKNALLIFSTVALALTTYLLVMMHLH